MTPVEQLAITAEVEASRQYQGIVFARAVEIVMRRKGIGVAPLAREIGVTRDQLRKCLLRKAAPLNAWQLWPKLVQALEL